MAMMRMRPPSFVAQGVISARAPLMAAKRVAISAQPKRINELAIGDRIPAWLRMGVFIMVSGLTDHFWRDQPDCGTRGIIFR
ncbi:hypothetical protein [Neorhizobium alkalisoli]|uniref:hypothetical protein n=1 Tax=Neorhizobium alkalisoli TaxID=528178 RepID=UPI001647E2C7|nr:hypothetical protein [Neorhizobium alkalisoli]